MTKFVMNFHKHAGQQEVRDYMDEFDPDIVTVCASRGWGKSIWTTCDVLLPFLLAEPNRQAMWVAPTYKICQSPIDDVWFGVDDDTGERFISEVDENGFRFWEYKKAAGEVHVFNKSKLYIRSATNPECYDDKTQVCTKNGWKLFKDVNKSDLVLSLGEGGISRWEYPEEVVSYDYSGDMIDYKNDRFHITVTPNHRMLTKTRQIKPQYKYRPAEDIYKINSILVPKGKVHQEDESVITIKGCSNGPIRLKTKDKIIYEKDWADFIGWYVSEGSCSQAGHSYRVVITQKKEKNLEKIKSLISRMGYNHYHDKLNNNFVISDKALYLHVREHCYVKGEKLNCYNKKIPEGFLDFSTSNLEILLDSLILGDGSTWKSGYREYYSTSKTLIDQVDLLCVALGCNVSKKIKKKRDSIIKGRVIKAENQADCWYLSISNRNNNTLPSGAKKVNYEGKVYCLQMPSGNMLVRKEGTKSIFCGNSIVSKGYGLIIIDEAALIPKEVFMKQILPTARRKGCKIVLISTPRGKNWFYEMYLDGQDKSKQKYASFAQPWWKRPDYPPLLIELMKDMPARLREQEFEAKFIDNGGGVFINFDNVFYGDEIEYPKQEQMWTHPDVDAILLKEESVMAVDLAKNYDYTVFVVLSQRTRQLLYYQRFNKTDYKFVIDRIVTVADRFNGCDVIYDGTGVGVGIGDFLDRELNSYPFIFTNQSKADIVQRLMVAFEYSNILMPKITTIVNEFLLYEYQITKTGKISYSAPEGKHDDIVVAVAMCNYHIEENGSNDILEIENFLQVVGGQNQGGSIWDAIANDND